MVKRHRVERGASLFAGWRPAEPLVPLIDVMTLGDKRSLNIVRNNEVSVALIRTFASSISRTCLTI
jgi:hypothetical protein